jgi:alpha-beta hydrolase superfamily lysophospholipase
MTGAQSTPHGWVADVLGSPFEQRTLPLGTDAEGEVVATVVRRLPNRLDAWFGPLRDVDVLYVHGWSDYFFQTEVAEFWNGLGARFYALDLRKYGRSLRDAQTPGYVTSLQVYDDDIAAAREAMREGDPRGRRRLLLLGHSTGGLILTLWAARHPGEASALVLNSPWLELQIGALGRQALAPLVRAAAWVDPLGRHPEVDLGFYTRAQRELGSLPEGHEAWRPARGFPTHPGWLAAVLAGHTTVAQGIDVGCPALVLLSSAWAPPLQWSDAMTAADSVLDVDDIARAATRIGTLVTIARVPGAIHDVFLSEAHARARAFDTVHRWTTGGFLG